MTERPRTDAATTSISRRLTAARERFRTAWEDALIGALPPSLDAYLVGFDGPDRAALREALEGIERGYLQRGTVALVPPDDPAAATVDTPRVSSAPTVNVRPPDTDPEIVTPPAEEAPAGGTVDFTPASPARTLDHAGASHAPEALPDQPAVALPEVAGYQILGMLGRGAMGVVYKARQRGLKRVVALKMILAGGHASAADQARFRGEAETVGQVQHANIVQVYEVGEHEGCPFFSLEYVEGGSLSKRLAGAPQPVRAAAHLVELLARGMQVAHERGVVHRDLKPANVMLAAPRPDGGPAEQLYGVPKIADFGLAKQLEGESGQTRSGTIIGTPSYMAPEQADGRVHDVGPPADVYALGAILYECLTGRPPFKGEGIWDTLDQVRTQEPVPPARLQPKLPRDLETICLKCLQKEPRKRYGSATELADDLHRFLIGEPIRARPVGAVERVWRWCRRNPVVAGLAAAVFVSLVAGTVVATAFAIEASNRAEEAERNEQIAVAQKKRAEQTRDAANDQRGVAEAAFKKILTEVQTKLRDTPDMSAEVRALRKQLLGVGVDGLEKIARSAERNADFLDMDPGLAKRARALTLMELGAMHGNDLNDAAAALEHYRKAHAILAELAREEPGSDKARGNLSVAHIRLGDMHLMLGRQSRAARDEYLKALAIRKDLVGRPRDKFYKPAEARKMVIDVHHKLALVANRLGDPAAARESYLKVLAFYDEAAKTAKPSEALYIIRASLYQALGDLSWRLRDEKWLADYEKKCLDIRKSLYQKAPGKPSLRRDLAISCGVFGDAHLRLNRPGSASVLYREAHGLLDGLAQKDSKSEYRWLLANSFYRLGTLATLQGQLDAAEPYFREALRIHSELATQYPADSPRQTVVLMALARCGEYDKAAAMADRLAKANKDNDESLRQIACAYAVCAEGVGPDDKRRAGYVAKALAALRGATDEDYRDGVALETDPELSVLRAEPAFRELLARLQPTKG